MMTEPELFGEALAAAGTPSGVDASAAHALVEAMWAARGEGVVPGENGPPAGTAVRAAARRVGTAAGDANEPIGSLIRRVNAIGATLARPAVESEAAHLADHARDAVAVAATAWAEAQEARREAWLSRLTHDIKGRLNVVSLNLWLLRQAQPGDSDKFEKIERAMARALELIKDVRELHDRAREPAPLPGAVRG